MDVGPFPPIQLNSDVYELLDFGDGRKLERFAGRLLDRPSPRIQQHRLLTNWPLPDAKFTGAKAEIGEWQERAPPPKQDWAFELGQVTSTCGKRPTATLGCFPSMLPNGLGSPHKSPNGRVAAC